jgi:vacuolar-type H+-ATPase subunit E/Vma4
MKVVSFGCRRGVRVYDPHQGRKNVLFVALWALFIGLLLSSMREYSSDREAFERLKERLRSAQEAVAMERQSMMDSALVKVGLLAYHVLKAIDDGYLAVVETVGLLTAGGETNTLSSTLPTALITLLALVLLAKCRPRPNKKDKNL